MTEIAVTPAQLAHTIAGNLGWKIQYVLGEHLTQFGRRDPSFYEDLAAGVFQAAVARTQVFEADGATPGGEHSRLLTMTEILAGVRRRIREGDEAYFEQCRAFYRRYGALAEERRRPRLPEEAIRSFLTDASETDFVTRVERQSLHVDPARFELPDQALYFKEKGARLLDRTLAETGARSVVNIGARIDQTSYFCAARHPDVRFLALDFQWSLREQNEIALGPSPPNLNFACGYALEMFEQGLAADLVFMMATSVLFTVDELRAYFAAFRQAGVRWVVLSESWASPLHGWDLADIPEPERIDPDRPYAGGSMHNLHHNYPRHLEAAGYRVLSSRVIDEFKGGGYNLLQLVAEAADG